MELQRESQYPSQSSHRSYKDKVKNLANQITEVKKRKSIP